MLWLETTSGCTHKIISFGASHLAGRFLSQHFLFMNTPARNVSLASHSTLHCGGEAHYFVEATSRDDLEEALIWADTEGLPAYILGGGSNVLFSDEGFDGLIVKMAIDGLKMQMDGRDTLVIAGAGMVWDTLVAHTVDAGLYGLENLSGIPGSVGASPVQNIGAYGSEISRTVEWVEVYDREEKTYKRLSADECAFDYRDSIFKHSEGKNTVVAEVAFRLSTQGVLNTEYADVAQYFLERAVENPTLQDVRRAILTIRASKFPHSGGLGTAGSFFKNPHLPTDHFNKLRERYPGMPGYATSSYLVKVPLAWILDHVLNLKGAWYDTVGLYEKQPLVMVTRKNATSRDVVSVAREVKQKVYEATGITIEPEVTILDKRGKKVAL